MWKKDEVAPSTPGATHQEERMPQHESPKPTTTRAASDPATIGPSITIKGEVRGDEDLLIEGRVEGSVELKLQSVTVGREGRVKANISGRVVTVEGEVEGDLAAQEQVILRSSARVQGDITAPRVVLEDGANFRGLVDMSEPARKETSSDRSARDTRSSSAGSKGGTDAKDAKDTKGVKDGKDEDTKGTSNGTLALGDKVSPEATDSATH